MVRLCALAAMAALTIGAGRAKAAVYVFTPTILDPEATPFFNSADLSFTIAIDDATVRSGSFSYRYRDQYTTSGNPPQTTEAFSATGDVQALQRFQAGYSAVSFSGGSGPQGSSSDYFDVNLAFDTSSGQVLGGNVDYSTDGYYVFVNGSGQFFSGTAGLGTVSPARVTGALVGGFATAVPEPASLGLVALGLVLVAGYRRHVERGILPNRRLSAVQFEPSDA